MTAPVLEHAYAALPDPFHARVAPTPVAAPRLLKLNEGLAEALGLDARWLASDDGIAMFAGNRLPEPAEPIAMAYAGHQFGQFNPQLGDGRAILLGEVVGHDGVRRDLQLKGSGRTPFSRQGDGRAAIGPVLREYVVSEGMAALGIPTTRALAAVATGEPVHRETALPGAVLTRVARTHVRVGTFEYFGRHGRPDLVQLLTDHVIRHVWPDAAEADDPALSLLQHVVDAQASLVARWLGVGFVHGVMNTDNTQVAGETIDYGPCAFLDHYEPGKVYSSIDRFGRYAYDRQPGIAGWNVARLAEALLPVLAGDADAQLAAAQGVLDGYGARFEAAWQTELRRKLALASEQDGDAELAQGWLDLMQNGRADFTLAFRALAGAAAGDGTGAQALHAHFEDATGVDAWLDRWRARLEQEGTRPADAAGALNAANPLFTPRNHRVEQAIAAAIQDDLAPFEALLEAVTHPYEDAPDRAHLATPPSPDEEVRETFCGT